MNDIWISTENKNKKYEFETLLEPLGFTVHTPSELETFESVEETGTTFAENALLKARALYELVKQPVIADDSGIVVDALGGAPGVYSARYAGEPSNDAANRQLLLKNMEHINDRAAHFVSVIALVVDATHEETFEDTVSGTLLYQESGTRGFGYDNLFYATELGKSFADATIEEKNTVSHRARALKKLLQSDFFAKNDTIETEEK